MAVFSLVGVAVVSLWINSGVRASADVINEVCVNSADNTFDDIFVSVAQQGKIILRSVTSAPVAAAKVTFIDVTDPSLKDSVLEQKGNTYTGEVALGAMPAGTSREITYESGNVSGQHPCVKVQTSADGIAYSATAVSKSIK